MSFLDRFRGIRQETSKRLWGTLSSKNAPPTFVSDFILEQAWNRDDPTHRGRMARRDPSAYQITHGLAHNVFDDGFIFVDTEDDEKEIMQDVLKDLERMDHLKYLGLALGGEREQGNAWLGVFPEDLDLRVGVIESDAPRIANLDYFTEETAEVVEYDDIGNPVKLEIKVLTNTGNKVNNEQRYPVYIKDCIPVRTRPYDRSHRGIPVTYPVWDALCGLNLVFYAITTYSMKMGVGALIMTTKGAVTAPDKAAAETAMEDLSISRVGVIPGRSVEKLEFIGASGSTIDFSAYINSYLEQIAAGSKYPKDALVGTSAGAITGSEVNSKALYAVIQGEQTAMEPVIREVVRRMGHLDDNYNIKWATRYATDEMQQAQIRVLNVQADEAEQRIKDAKEGKNDFQMKRIKIQREDNERGDKNQFADVRR